MSTRSAKRALEPDLALTRLLLPRFRIVGHRPVEGQARMDRHQETIGSRAILVRILIVIRRHVVDRAIMELLALARARESYWVKLLATAAAKIECVESLGVVLRIVDLGIDGNIARAGRIERGVGAPRSSQELMQFEDKERSVASTLHSVAFRRRWLQ